MSNKPEEKIQEVVSGVIELQQSLQDLEAELATNEVFQTFLTKQKQARAEIDATWKTIEQQMIEHDVKSVKGEWGSITIAERTNYKVENLDELPAKFIKKVADTTKIGTYHKLEDKLPKGVTISTTKYLTKRIK